MEIDISIQQADALKIKADVLVLKYAQELHGVDEAVFIRLALSYKHLEKKLPRPSDFLLVENPGNVGLGADRFLFAGVDVLHKFRYKEIRDFAFNSLAHLATVKPGLEHICFTSHGVSYGLDETEAFKAEVAGIADAIAQGLHPSGLKKITIAEIHEERAKRLKAVLRELLPGGLVQIATTRGVTRSLETDRLSQAGINSEEKPLIFVAMPFDKKMEDVFHYGIRNAVNQAGYLCERADEVVFTGDILDLIKRRINNATLMIADLTSANPNVYLEVGYAWGVGVPTVLIAQDPQELRFDVKGQKCIIYSGIRELEEKLGRELLGLKR
ncbi:MAG TPA: hypothetical protein VK897_17295 [Anaerolineales bacterium]|nr:hypothetical protein [Anaerolineales bacterium]